MKILSAPSTLALLVAGSAAVTLSAAETQNKGTNSVFEQQLRSQYVLAQASHFNRVSAAGTILVIQQAGLNAAPPASLSGPMAWYTNTFKDGKRQNHGLVELSWQSQGILRPIQPGDRFYLSKLDVKDSAVTFYLVSCEQIEGKYYYAGVSFQFGKGYQASRAFSDIQLAIAQVFTIEDQKNQDAQASQPASQPVTPSPAAPAPQTPQVQQAEPTRIELGQTVEQVVAAMGQPEKIVNLGEKQLYVYKDLKITFLNGKVSDVQ
jgi:hypothetical protein